MADEELGSDEITVGTFERAQQLFDAMYAEARETADGRVWEGHTTQLCRDLHINQGYYTSVMRALTDMGCLIQLKRGGGAGMSKWHLITRPALEAFEGRDISIKPGRSSTTRLATMQQQLTDQNRRIGYLERELADIKRFLGMDNGTLRRPTAAGPDISRVSP